MTNSVNTNALAVVLDAMQLVNQAEQRTSEHNEEAFTGLDRLMTAAEQCSSLFFQALAQKRAELDTLQRERREDSRVFETRLQEGIKQIDALLALVEAQDSQLRALQQENTECQRTFTELDRRLQGVNASVQEAHGALDSQLHLLGP